jgi:hypothetical protein
VLKNVQNIRFFIKLYNIVSEKLNMFYLWIPGGRFKFCMIKHMINYVLYALWKIFECLPSIHEPAVMHISHTFILDNS